MFVFCIKQCLGNSSSCAISHIPLILHPIPQRYVTVSRCDGHPPFDIVAELISNHNPRRSQLIILHPIPHSRFDRHPPFEIVAELKNNSRRRECLPPRSPQFNRSLHLPWHLLIKPHASSPGRSTGLPGMEQQRRLHMVSKKGLQLSSMAISFIAVKPSRD